MFLAMTGKYMNSVKVKICGVRTIPAAQAVAQAGGDFIGFNFIPTSKRAISLEQAKKIRAIIPSSVKVVGVFQDAPQGIVNEYKDALQLDFIQLHGNESQEYITQITGAQVIKVITVPASFDVNQVFQKIQSYTVNYFMLDREKQAEYLLNPDLVREITGRFPIFLAGGLTPENVSHIVQHARPFAVDVASGIETDGKEDMQKIQKFILNAKGDGMLNQVQHDK